MYKFRKRARTVTAQYEEAYLRSDISCGSKACPACAVTAPALAADASHYVVPDSQALADFLGVFELPEMANYVLLTSVLRKVSDADARLMPGVCLRVGHHVACIHAQAPGLQTSAHHR